MHTLICGVTQSGKTTLAREIARSLMKRGQSVIVYDPVGTGTAGGGWPDGAMLFDDEEEFFEYLSRDDINGAHVFIDEAGDLFNVSRKENMWLLTRGRHFGLFIYLIAQRPKMIAPSARTQCGALYMFRLAQDDAQEIGKDYGFNDFHRISLDKGDFIMVYSGTSARKTGNIFKMIPAE